MRIKKTYRLGKLSGYSEFGRTKLYELINSGDIEAIKLGRRTLVCTQSARDFLNKLPRIGGAS